MMATITPIYTPVSSIADTPTAFIPVTTKSSLRDYRKPKAKGTQSQTSHIFKTSTNASTNNRITLPISEDKHTPHVPDEISVTTVIGPPGNKGKSASSSHHQEPAIISCYPVTKSTNNGSTKRQVSELSEVSTAKKMKGAASSQDKNYPFPRGLTITEVNVTTAKSQDNAVGLMINPLNVCATSLEQHQNEDDDDDVIPVLHLSLIHI